MITRKNIKIITDNEFKKWFTMPISKFNPEIQKLLKNIAKTSYKAGATMMLGEVNKYNANLDEIESQIKNQ